MTDKESIKIKLSQLKNNYLSCGIEIIGIFGSVAKGINDNFSDIDIAYKLNKNIFFNKYKDGFSQILKLEEIKQELEKELNSRVDFINIAPNKELQKDISKDMLYV